MSVLNPTFPSATMEQAPLFHCHDCKSSKTMDQLELRKRKNNPVFVASWTTPPPPDPPPPPWPPPHFHGHVFEAFSILQGEYHVSFSKECAEIFKTLPTAHGYHTSRAFVAQPHSPRAFLQFLARSDDGTRRTERTPVRKSFLASYNIS